MIKKKNKINKRRDYVVVVELQYCDHHVERERERKKKSIFHSVCLSINPF